MEKSKLKRLLVECTFRIPIEVPDNEDYNEYFAIEENSCPGTGPVWAALRKRIKHSEKEGYCWACELGATNKIIDERNKTQSLAD